MVTVMRIAIVFPFLFITKMLARICLQIMKILLLFFPSLGAGLLVSSAVLLAGWIGKRKDVKERVSEGNIKLDLMKPATNRGRIRINVKFRDGHSPISPTTPPKKKSRGT